MRDSRDPSRAGSTKQIEKDGFDVIVFGVSRAQNVTRREEAFERFVAGSARHSLVNARVVIVLRQHCVEHREVDRQPPAHYVAVARPSSGIRVQMVIDVDGAHMQSAVPIARPRKGVEQRERIRSSAEGDNETRPRRVLGRESGNRLGAEPLGAVSIHGGTAGPAHPIRSSGDVTVR